jgi:hypothetical protein
MIRSPVEPCAVALLQRPVSTDSTIVSFCESRTEKRSRVLSLAGESQLNGCTRHCACVQSLDALPRIVSVALDSA